MDGSLPVTANLASSSGKSERRAGGRSKSHGSSQSSATATLLLAFLSCLAWLYVAEVVDVNNLDCETGENNFSEFDSDACLPLLYRLWQDAENRKLLANLLQKNLSERPKVLTVEDKLMILGCKDLQRRIVEVEMDLAFAKSQGYLRNQSKQSKQKLLAVIGVYTGFGSRLKRNIFRGSWMPTGEKLRKLEESGVVIRFIIGRSPNRGDSLDRNIDEENRKTRDFLILEGHEEAQEELPKKAKFFFSTAVQNWDAEFYVKVDDSISLDLDNLITMLESRRTQDKAYVGCMKSGDVIADEGKQWYEPEWWKFGDKKSYFRHAGGSLMILSKSLAEYIFINSASLKTFAHDDTSIGSWMIGLQATYIDDSRLCCSLSTQDKVCSVA